MQAIFDLFDRYPAIPIGMLLTLFVVGLVKRRGGRRSGKASAARGRSGFLDRVILDLGGIPFTGKMATEGMFTCAELGWGKTFLVFQRVLKAYARAGMGGYICGAKSED